MQAVRANSQASKLQSPIVCNIQQSTQVQQQRNNLTQAREAHLSPVVMSRLRIRLCLRFRMSIIYICAFVSRLFVWCTRAEAAAQRGTSVTWGCLARIFKYSPRTGRRAEGAVQHEENHMLTGILACAACITSHRYTFHHYFVDIKTRESLSRKRRGNVKSAMPHLFFSFYTLLLLCRVWNGRVWLLRVSA